jgi:hypothetical protein
MTGMVFVQLDDLSQRRFKLSFGSWEKIRDSEGVKEVSHNVHTS